MDWPGKIWRGPSAGLVYTRSLSSCRSGRISQRVRSVGRAVAADSESGGLQLGHPELVEQLVIGAVRADRRQRIRRRLSQQLVAEGEGDIGAGDVADPDLGDSLLFERIGSLIDVERRLELPGAQGRRGRGDGGEGAELDRLEALRLSSTPTVMLVEANSIDGRVTLHQFHRARHRSSC